MRKGNARFMMPKKLSLSLVVAIIFVVQAGCTSLSTGDSGFARVSNSGQPALYVWPVQNSHSNNEATLHLAVRAGSLQEMDPQRGFAHYVEHMAFNGTAAFPKASIRKRLEELGLDVGDHSNAYTTYDHTLYSITLNSINRERLEAGIELLAEWAYNIRFDADEVAQERSVILEEWRQRESEPGRVSTQLREHYYRGSRHLDRAPIGTPDSIRNASPQRLKQFYDRWYQPDNMAVIVAGDVDSDAVQQLFQRYFPPRQKGSSSEPQAYRINPDAMPDFLTASDGYVGTGQVDLTYFIRVPPILTARDLTTKLSMEAALDIWHQRANAELINTRGAVDQVEYDWTYLDSDFIQLQLSARMPGSDLRRGLLLLEQQRVNLVSQGVTEQELHNWRRERIEYERSVQDSADNLAQSALNHFLMEWPMVAQERWIELIEETVPTLTPDTVQSALREITSTRPKVRMVHSLDTPAPSAENVEDWLSSVKPRPQTPAPSNSDRPRQWAVQPQNTGTITNTQSHSNGVTEWTLSNNITVLHRYSDQIPGKFHYSLSGVGGLNALSEENTRVARLALPTLAASGLRDLNGTQLSEWLAANAMEQIPHFSFIHRGIDGAAPSSRFPVAMRLLHIALTEGRVDPDTWTQVKAQNRANLEQHRNHPHWPLNRMVETLLYQNDPALTTMTFDELNAIRPEQMLAVYQAYFAGAQNYRLAVVGDIDRDAVRQSILQNIATLPSNNGLAEPCNCRSFPSPPVSASRHVNGSGEQEARVTLRYSVDKATFGPANNVSLSVLRQWVQSQLMEELRENQGLAYSIHVQLDGLLVKQNEFTLIISVATDPELTDTVVFETESIMAAMMSRPETPAQIERWWQSQIDSKRQALNDAKTQATTLANAPLLGQTVEMALASGAELNVPSPENISDSLRPFMSDHAVRVEIVWLP